MNKAYNKITWQNKPSTATPLNQTNLNEMSNALDTIDDRVIALDSGKVSSVTVTNTLPTGDTIATITVDGTATNIKSAQVVVDSTPSATSENPLQNKAIYEMLNNLLPEETVQGNPIAISDASGLNAKACSVDLLPIQDLSHGDPSPTNICPISGRTEVNLGNLCDDMDNMLQNPITHNAVPSTTSSTVLGSNIAVEAGKTYFLSCIQEQAQTSSTRNTLYVYVNGANVYESIQGNYHLNTGLHYIIFTPSTNQNISFGIWTHTISNNTTYDNFILSAYQYTENFGQTVYGGTLDVTNGKLTIDKAVVTYVGNEGWYEHSSGRFYVNGIPSGIDISKRGQNNLFKCNTRSYITDQTGYGAYIFYGSAGLYCSKKDANETLSDFTTALGTTNMQVTYPLATPVEITLTPEEISLLKGNNVISTDGDNINLVYSADIKAWVENQLQS